MSSNKLGTKAVKISHYSFVYRLLAGCKYSRHLQIEAPGSLKLGLSCCIHLDSIQLWSSGLSYNTL
jgi:hypothetical protein